MDDLDRSIAARRAACPGYGELLSSAVRRQRLIARLVERRKANGLTQAVVAEQGTGRILAPDRLRLEGVSDGEWDAFFAAAGLDG